MSQILWDAEPVLWDNTPAFWGEGGLPVFSHTGTGGAVVLGSALEGFSIPNEFFHTAEGGVFVGGAAIITFSAGSDFFYVATGGIVTSGVAENSFAPAEPADIPFTERQPVNVTATFDVQASTTEATIAWDAVADADGYVVQWGLAVEGQPGEGGPYQISDSGSATSFTLTNLVPGLWYEARVRAYQVNE